MLGGREAMGPARMRMDVRVDNWTEGQHGKQHVDVSEQLQMRERWPVGDRRAASPRPSPLSVH